MYVCSNCLNVFESPRKDNVCGAVFITCPQCDSSDFVHTQRCERCGEWITGKYISIGDNVLFCEDCYDEYDIFEQNKEV